MSARSGPTPLVADKRNTVIGIGLIVAAVLIFSLMDSSAKWLGRQVNPMMALAARYIVSFVCVGFFFNPWTRPGLWRTPSRGIQIARALCLLAATLSGWTAVRFLPLTQLTSITFAAPLIVALLAGPFLGERIGIRRVLAVCLGFVGVLVVTRPFGNATHPAAALAAAAALANALYSLLTRKLADRDPPETTLFYTGLVGSVVLLPVVPFAWVRPPSGAVWAVLIGVGMLGAMAHWLLILAHRRAAASTLAPFYYAQIVGAVGLGYLFFDEVPDGWTAVGTLIVIGSGLYVFHRERARKAAT